MSDTSWTFPIPVANLPALRERLATLAKRAVKIGVAPILISEGEPEDRRESYMTEDGRSHPVTRRHIPVTVSQPAPVILAGWEFCGTIDHAASEDGQPLNILRAVPSFAGSLPVAYRTNAPTCDHCHTSRRRRETFVVRHEGGELRRIGRQCIRDYLGHESAESILSAARYLADARAACEEGEGGSCGSGEWRYSPMDVLSWAATAIRTEGWLSKAQARDRDCDPTAAHVSRWLSWPMRPHSPKETPPPEQTERDGADATDALGWARDINPDTDSDYLHNVRVILSQGSVGPAEMGIAVSAMAVYLRERDQAIARRVWLSKPSTYLANVGQRFGGKKKTDLPAIEANVMRRHSFEGDFGVTTILSLQTDDGNDLLWFASGEQPDDIQVGRRVSVVGSVKAHKPDPKTGRPTTHLTRASLTVIGAAPRVVEVVAA